jgi:hypothetical protein
MRPGTSGRTARSSSRVALNPCHLWAATRPVGWLRIATVGQTITVPSGDSVLSEFTFHYESELARRCGAAPAAAAGVG